MKITFEICYYLKLDEFELPNLKLNTINHHFLLSVERCIIKFYCQNLRL